MLKRIEGNKKTSQTTVLTPSHSHLAAKSFIYKAIKDNRFFHRLQHGNVQSPSINRQGSVKRPLDTFARGCHSGFGAIVVDALRAASTILDRVGVAVQGTRIGFCNGLA